MPEGNNKRQRERNWISLGITHETWHVTPPFTSTEQGSKDSHGHSDSEAPKVEEKIFSDEELVALIDPILQMDDFNKDGFIDYPEFIRAQQKAQNKN